MDEEKRYGNYLLLFTIIASLTNAFSSHYQLTLPDSWLIELATSHTSLSKEIIVNIFIDYFCPMSFTPFYTCKQFRPVLILPICS